MDQITGINIMVLDDEAFMLKLMTRVLNNLGFFSVTSCDSGHDALSNIDTQSNPPNLILLDLNMPEMDGIEFVRHLVDRAYDGSLILVSGEDERMLQTAENLVRAHKISILGHLNKPFKPEALSALLDTWTPPTKGTHRTTRKVYAAEDVRKAIASGELVNHYQPKVKISTGAVVGVEALVRWQHPVDGLVLPDQFIGLAEVNHLIDDLSRVVLTNALTQSKRWQAAGLDLRMAVNISMDNLKSVAFADFVFDLANTTITTPQNIVLEVTESRLMQNLRSSLDNLTRFRLRRFGLSIDDFGTGNSTLAQLRDIPFNELKIDRGFVHGVNNNKTLRAMYLASLSLARQLGIEVVAEGVEDRKDWDYLYETGCDLAQGYFIARPMEASEIPDWIKSWQQRVRTELITGGEDA